MTRLAGRQSDFLDRVGLRVWIQTRNKRKQKKDGIAGTEFFFFSGKKQEIYFSRARLGQKDRKEQVQVLAMGLGLERPDAKVPEQKVLQTI